MTITLSFGGYQGDKSVHTRGGRVLADAIARHTQGEVRVTFDESIVTRGHKASDLLSMTEDGTLDGCYFSSSYLAARVPELGLFDQHFAVPDRRRAYAILDGEMGARLRECVEANTGYSVLGYWDNGLRHITSRQPIHTLEDCSGLTIRTLANDDHQRVFRALGFAPKAIDVRDLPAAVHDGEVDAQENPLTNTFNFGLHKTHRFVTLTRHLLGVALVLFNAKTVAGWPVDVRAAIQAAVDEATVAQRRFAQDDDTVCTQALANEGVAIIDLDDAARTEFADVARSAVAITRARFDPQLTAIFDATLKNA